MHTATLNSTAYLVGVVPRIQRTPDILGQDPIANSQWVALIAYLCVLQVYIL